MIIGGGGAGLEAALSATRTGARVAVVDKGIISRSGCTILGSFSCNAALGHEDPEDNPFFHFSDTVKEGKYINNQMLAKLYVEKAPQRVLALHKNGAVFEEKNSGVLKQSMVPGHSFPRAVFNNLHTGKSMVRALMNQVKKAQIDLFNEIIIFDVVVKNNTVSGCVGYDLTGYFAIFSCKAVIIAAGGCGQLYPYSTTSTGATGDGVILAHSAGAELQDMEFIQFFPTAQCYPRLPGLNPTIPSMLRYKGGCRLYNAQGTEFMKEKMSDWRFKVTRDELSKAIYTEITEGRESPHGGVYMDVLHLTDEEIIDTFSFAHLFDDFLKMGIDLRTDRIETAVAAHFSMGGIKVDKTLSTCVSGLFAAGEVAAGIHGANRLPGNALSDILVTGYEAGVHAAEYAAKKDLRIINGNKSLRKIGTIMEQKGSIPPVHIKKRIQKIMWKNIGVVKNKSGLLEGIESLKKIKKDIKNIYVSTRTYVWNKELVDALEAEFMVKAAILIAQAAHYRKESRGSHFREDYPEENPSWQVNVVIHNGVMKKESVVEMEEFNE